MPARAVNPVLTLVNGYGVDACGVMIDTDPLPLAVQRWVPSKAMRIGKSARPLAATVAAPGACVGSITYTTPGVPPFVTKTLPAAAKTPSLVAPVQVLR